MSQSPYKLFIDDERFPPDDGGNWVIARTLDETKAVVAERGFPAFISFDHDLGLNTASGHEIAWWIVNTDLELSGVLIPQQFDFYVHSQNPVGAGNIEALLREYLRFKAREAA